MSLLDETLHILRAELPYLHQQYHVKQLGVMGSVARGEATPQSDIDVLVEFDGRIGLRFVDLVDHLEAKLNRPVDVISRRAIRPEVWSEIESEVVYV